MADNHGQIELNVDDDVFTRARKIWRLIGFVNDRHGTCNLIAEYLHAYKQLDEMQIKSERIAKGDL